MTNACSGLVSSNADLSSTSAAEPVVGAETSSGATSSPSLRPNISLRQLSDRCVVCDAELNISQLEQEAFAAVRELAYSVKLISLSELLPRTSELVFVNLTTFEGNVYCIELTRRGWRIASTRHDCMNGDFKQLDVHTRYFETIYQLLDVVSPEYRHRFGEKLTSELQKVVASRESEVKN